MTILDLSGMRAYLDGDKEEEREIIQVFVSKAQKDLEAIKASSDGVSLEAWQESCHSLKGSAALLGAFILRDLCHEGETMGGCDVTAQQAVFSRIAEAYDAVLAALNDEGLL
jgi:HPt (histidine-containing phosphotransfer) domain-containing protein